MGLTGEAVTTCWGVWLKPSKGEGTYSQVYWIDSR